VNEKAEVTSFFGVACFDDECAEQAHQRGLVISSFRLNLTVQTLVGSFPGVIVPIPQRA